MKYWLLAAACVVYGLALLALSHAQPGVVRAGLFATYAIAGVASVVTALSYAPRDRLRWAWLSFGAGYLIAFASKLFVGDGAAIPTMSTGRQVAWSVMVLLLNVGSVTAFALFARAWSGTGMAPPWLRRATGVFLAIALLIDAKSLWTALQAMLAGNVWAFGFFSSVAGDIIAVTLVGPIFATAVALRGGILMRPWLFLFVAAVCWLSVDVISILPIEVRTDLDIVMRPVAILFGGAAAVAQLLVKHDVKASLAEAPERLSDAV